MAPLEFGGLARLLHLLCRVHLVQAQTPERATALLRAMSIKGWMPLMYLTSMIGVVHMRKVTIARDLGTQVEVTDGLKDGDQVILNPSVNLAEGSKVEAQPEQTASSK